MLPGIRWPCSAKPHNSHLLPKESRKRSHVCFVRPEGKHEPSDGSESSSNNSNFRPGLSPQPNSGTSQQQSSWGSNWKRKSVGSGDKPPVSYFRQQAEAASQTPTPQNASSSEQSTQKPSNERQTDRQLEASIRQNVDRAAETLQEIITEVLNEMLVEEASSYVMDEQGPALQINQAVRNAVVTRLEWLDSNFLATLNAYLAAPSVQGNKELSELLRAVRDEVLDLVSARLPPAVQVLNSALQHDTRAGRAAIVQLALSGGEGPIPAVGLDALGAAAHQLVDDMEDQQVVADRVLLARLVLLREELRMRAEEQDAQSFFASDANPAHADNNEHGDTATTDDGNQVPSRVLGPDATQGQQDKQWSNRFYGFHRSNLPVRCAAFMKELLSVPERDRRLGLLSKAFQEDWVGESMTSEPGARGQKASKTASAGLKDITGGHQERSESLDIVRPGRFLSTLHAMRAELERHCSALAAAESQARDLELLQQLDIVKLEALVALDRLQQSRSMSASGGSCDYELELNRLP